MRCTAELVSDPKFNYVLDAAQQGPVVIERAQEEVALVISARQYRLWRRQAVDDFNQFCDEISDRAEVRGMTEDKLNELLSSD